LADDIALTVNYSHLYRVVERVVTGTPAKLLETVAERIAAAVLAECRGGEVRVRVRKLAPPIKGATVGTAGVEVVRRGISQPAVPD
ncbi:MAG: dihydroneopterin aldolase, partial [Chloroflexi bacterium]|nr:dihydroneopterin aldolase [Chloroflexota bacterium]